MKIKIFCYVLTIIFLIIFPYFPNVLLCTQAKTEIIYWPITLVVFWISLEILYIFAADECRILTDFVGVSCWGGGGFRTMNSVKYRVVSLIRKYGSA